LNPEQKEIPSRKNRASFGVPDHGWHFSERTRKVYNAIGGIFSLGDDRRNKGAGHSPEGSSCYSKKKNHQCCLGLRRFCNSCHSSGLTSSAGAALCYHTDTLQCSRAA